MNARAHEKDDDSSVVEPLDPEFVKRIEESLADPRPPIPASEVRASLRALHEARLEPDLLAQGGPT